VVIGTGELGWPQLIGDAELGRLKPIYNVTDREFNLAEVPVPVFELLDRDKYNRLTVQTGGGCSHRCEFCANLILLTRKYKQKPAAKVLAEIDEARSLLDHVFAVSYRRLVTR
jgi:radical SAM superfamily enzyme YgiQ (UPF0313 family)